MGNVKSRTTKEKSPTIYQRALREEWAAIIERVQTHPKEAFYRNNAKLCALHWACHCNTVDPECVRVLIEANPKSLLNRSKGGYTPLHIAVWRDLPVSVIEVLCGVGLSERAMKMITKRNVNHQYNNLPIHNGVGTASVETSSANTIALTGLVQNPRGFTPLHMACWKNTSQNVISLLLNHCPQAALSVTFQKDTPLHFSALHRANDQLLELFIQLAPDCLTIQNDEGDTPLHILCRSDATSPAIIQQIVNIAPQVLGMTNNNGDTCLHVAYSIGALSKECCLLLIRHSPSACFMTNNNAGETPLYSASYVNCSVEEMYELIHANSDAATTHIAEDRTQTPIYAWYNGYRKSVSWKGHNNYSLDTDPFLKEFCRGCYLLVFTMYYNRLIHPYSLDSPTVIRKCMQAATTLYNLERIPLFVFEIMSRSFSNQVSNGAIQCKRRYPNGRFLLSDLIERGADFSTSAISSVVSQCPNVLIVRDHKTKLYPFMIAAASTTVNNRDGGARQVENIYELLRANPGVLDSCSYADGCKIETPVATRYELAWARCISYDATFRKDDNNSFFGYNQNEEQKTESTPYRKTILCAESPFKKLSRHNACECGL